MQDYKHYVSAQHLLDLSFLLASKVFDSRFRPTWVLGIWRGGAPIGIAVQEFFKYKNITTNHIAIRTSSYKGTEQNSTISVHGLEYFVKNANTNDPILIIDDIFDSGKSCKAILEKIKLKMRANTPSVIKIATVFWKPKNNKTDIVPDYYCLITDKWVVFPHELEQMTFEEIVVSKGQTIANCVYDIEK